MTLTVSYLSIHLVSDSSFSCPGGFTVVCSALGTQGSEAKVSSEPSGVTRAPVGSASTEGLQSSQGGDEELEIDEEHLVEHFSHGKTRKALLKVKTECVT